VQFVIFRAAGVFERRRHSDLLSCGRSCRSGDVYITDSSCYRLLWYVNADLSLEDSGNYTCEVRGPKSSIMAAVTHYIFIRGTV